jgi:hypothetical protein
VTKVILVIRGQKVTKDRQDRKGLKVIQAHRVTLETQAYKDRKVSRASKAKQGHRGQQDRQGHKVQQVRAIALHSQ